MWKPEKASEDMEKKLEDQQVPEEDRDEVRRLAEFLRRRKAKRNGEELPPAPEGMRDWLLGKE